VLTREPLQSLELVRQYAAMGGKLFMSGPMAPVMAQEEIGNELVKLLKYVTETYGSVVIRGSELSDERFLSLASLSTCLQLSVPTTSCPPRS
jgi:hypothetical protein